MTIHLPEDVESDILAAVQNGQFASMDDAMTKAASLLLERLKQQPQEANTRAAGEEAPASAHKPIWEVIEEENRSIPPEVWDALPTDLAEQHDHYIYGTPKRPAK
jgi:Arc/MetJ-type ribon-helix-helix transcriptional regulator